MKNEIISSTDPKSPVSEVFRTLRTNLQYLNKKNGAQTILITSTIPGEGKSFVAANLAVTFAQARKKTIIVDTDMRKPRQHKLLNSDMYPGLSNYLAGVSIGRGNHRITVNECIYKTTEENLFVLPAGNIPPNPSELLQSEKLGKLVKILKNEYDVVVFDGAPCLLVTDATLVSRLVDATILVVSQGKTKIDDLKEVKNRIRRVGGRVAGVVLNRIKISGRRYGEKYYYYYDSDSLIDKTKRRNNAESETEPEEVYQNQIKKNRNNRRFDDSRLEQNRVSVYNSVMENAEDKEGTDSAKKDKVRGTIYNRNNKELKKNLMNNLKAGRKKRYYNSNDEGENSIDNEEIVFDENDLIGEKNSIRDNATTGKKDSTHDNAIIGEKDMIRENVSIDKKDIMEHNVEIAEKNMVDEDKTKEKDDNQGSEKIKKILADIQKMKEDIK